MKRTYRFRAYPSKGQKSILNRQMQLSKELYNHLLEKAQQHFKDTGKTFTKYEMNKWITRFKREHLEYNEIYSQALQNVSDRVSKAYKNFFRRVKGKHNGKKQKVGFPRFRKFTSSLTYPQSGFKIERKRVELSKIGRINFVNHRETEGMVKTLTVKKTKSQEWYVTIAVEKENPTRFSNEKEMVGIDLGINNYATLSDRTVKQNIKITGKQRNRMRRLQQGISRKTKGSRNRKKAIYRFSKYAEHISRLREDSLHKLSHNLVNSYSFIAYEELDVAGMVRNHRLAKAISESSWGNFTQLLQYKAESAGCVAVGVNPQNTSKTCSGCGNLQEMPLSERIFNCEKCGMSKDRDLNASINILKRATEGHSGSHAFGDNVRPPHMGAVVKERGTTSGVSR
ncbi:MAG: transposase [Candidatus Micrarchaeota archaeon]|nr:transposase [Candidatus Micrarchaeota archaeon]MDE1849892.1 transposase [Candidatus Micrarchaeota archaeon]